MGGPFQGQIRVMEITDGHKYFTEYDATDAYDEKSFGAVCTKIVIFNDSDHNCNISWDGTTLHGKLLPGESQTFTTEGADSIFVRVDDATGTNNIRIWAY